MDDLQRVLTVIQRNSWVTGTDPGMLGLILYESYGISDNVSERLILQCLQNDLIHYNGRAYFLTSKGEDYLRLNEHANSKYDKPATAPISKQLSRIAKSNIWPWLKGMFWAIVAGILGNAAWEKYKAVSAAKSESMQESIRTIRRK